MKTDVQTQKSRETASVRDGDGAHDTQETRRPRIYPAYEVWEEKDSFRLRLEMPGLTRDDVEITVESNQLVIQGRRPDWTVGGTVLLRERRVGDYYRAFTLDKTVDTEAITATMKNGILDISLGLAKEAKPRRIEIKTN
jgi:HSP20 family protein